MNIFWIPVGKSVRVARGVAAANGFNGLPKQHINVLAGAIDISRGKATINIPRKLFRMNEDLCKTLIGINGNVNIPSELLAENKLAGISIVPKFSASVNAVLGKLDKEEQSVILSSALQDGFSINMIIRFLGKTEKKLGLHISDKIRAINDIPSLLKKRLDPEQMVKLFENVAVETKDYAYSAIKAIPAAFEEEISQDKMIELFHFIESETPGEFKAKAMQGLPSAIKRLQTMDAVIAYYKTQNEKAVKSQIVNEYIHVNATKDNPATESFRTYRVYPDGEPDYR